MAWNDTVIMDSVESWRQYFWGGNTTTQQEFENRLYAQWTYNPNNWRETGSGSAPISDVLWWNWLIGSIMFAELGYVLVVDYADLWIDSWLEYDTTGTLPESNHQVRIDFETQVNNSTLWLSLIPSIYQERWSRFHSILIDMYYENPSQTTYMMICYLWSGYYLSGYQTHPNDQHDTNMYLLADESELAM